jgi:hypothetical protein
MFGSAILEVAIGMVFVYLLLSLICSALNEFIEARVKNRAKGLEKGITNLLGDPALIAKFYEHPLIQALYSRGDRPSYIPAGTFSLTLWNLATYAEEGKDAAVAVTRNLKEIRRTVAQLPASNLRQALLSLMDEAGNDLEKARANIERWYDDSMDRVSGWYKRRTQWILLALGLGFAVVLNIDSLKIADALYRDGPLRSAIAATAEGYAAANKSSGDVTDKEGIKKTFERIDSLGIPLRWTRKDFPENTDGFWIWLCTVFLKAAGLLATALAVSLGAPFWFDVLNKFMVVRSTIKPREKSQEAPSKDKPRPEAEEEKKEEGKDSTGGGTSKD